jgi:hypothetical protein
MKMLLLSSFLLFTGYILTVTAVNRGIPASISDSFYVLNGKKKDAGYIFTAWCYAIGISVMGIVFCLSQGEWYQFLGMFAGGGLCFTGTAPLFKSHERLIHYVSATTCALSAALWLLFSGYGIFLTPLPFVFFMGREKRMFRLELALFIIMYISLFIIHSK